MAKEKKEEKVEVEVKKVDVNEQGEKKIDEGQFHKKA